MATRRIIIEKDDAHPWRATFEGDVSRADINRVLRTLLVWYKKYKLKGTMQKKQAELNRAEEMRKASANTPKEPEPKKSVEIKHNPPPLKPKLKPTPSLKG